MKIFTNRTYLYVDFINKEQQTTLIDWALSNKDNLEPNLGGPNRWFNRIDRLGDLPPLIDELRNRIVELEDIEVVAEAPHLGDYLSIQKEGAFIEPHRDYNGTSYYFYTRRYNLLISLPESGGQPIYDGETINVPERSLWRSDAGLVVHSSVPNVGSKPRINLSFGFLMPIDTQYKP